MALNHWGCGITFSVKDGATAAMGRVERSFRSASSAADTAVAKLGRVERAARLFRAPIHLLLNVRDRASSVLARVRRSIFSLQGMMTLSLGAVGIGGAFAGTVGAAAMRERQDVSMLHFLKGDKAKAAAMSSWLEDFANRTPFEMDDIFPAGARAVGITGGDIGRAKVLLKLAGDMAALTPGKTVKDAMEALADAQMGEMERLKEFNFKITKEQMDRMGGFGAAVLKMMGHFAGGAEKLSKTASGQWSTFTDRIKNTLMVAGFGGLEEIKPRLERINRWFDQNSGKVKAWAARLKEWFRQLFGFVLDKIEAVGLWLRDNVFENPAFERADPARKLEMLWEGARPTVERIGVALGKIIGRGVVEGIKSGLGLSMEGLKEMDLSKMLIGGAFSGAVLKMTGLGSVLGWLGKKAIGALPGLRGLLGSLSGTRRLMLPLFKRAPIAGALLGGLTVLLSKNKAEAASGVIGSLVGGALGAKVGATIGALGGPIGVVLGTTIGGIAGGILGDHLLRGIDWPGIWQGLKDTGSAMRDGFIALWHMVPQGVREAIAGVPGVLLDVFMTPIRAIGGGIDWLLGKLGLFKSDLNGVNVPQGGPNGRSGAGLFAARDYGGTQEAPMGLHVPRHADGGVFALPHLALIAEGGPEAVVPLSPSKRQQATPILSMAASALGLRRGGGETQAPARMSVRQPVQLVLDGRVIAETVLDFKEDRDVRRVMPGGWDLNGV